MARVLYCVPAWWSGVWHRFMLLDQIRSFTDHFGYDLKFLWGASDGVAFCKFEDLFSPIRGIKVTNVSDEVVRNLERITATGTALSFDGRPLRVFRSGAALSEHMLLYDNPQAAESLEKMVPPERRAAKALRATAAPAIQAQINRFVKHHNIPARLGIRVRVTECLLERRKPHRVHRELNDAVRSIIHFPWHTKVFIVTDSEYVQQVLASHFYDSVFFQKRFDLRECGSRYVHRHDREAMFTFLKEVMCLCTCRKIINVGGFFNQQSVDEKIVWAYYNASLL
jgi:hypothetical protein